MEDQKAERRVIQIEINGAKMWMDVEQWQLEQNWYRMVEALYPLTIEDYPLRERQAIYDQFNLGVYKEPNKPNRLGYFIITDRGIMWKEGDKVYAFKKDEMYVPEDEPFTGDYKFIRNARPMDI